MASLETPQLLLDSYFNDVSEYAQLVDWDFDFRQLDSGSPKLRAAVLGTSQSVAMRCELNRAYHQAGCPPSSMITLGLPDLNDSEFQWCGKKAGGGDILNFNLESGFEGISGTGFSGYTLSFSKELLQETLETLELETNLLDVFQKSETWTNSGEVTETIREGLVDAFLTASTSNDPGAAELFSFSAAALLLEHLSDREAGSRAISQISKRRAVRRSLECLADADTAPLTVSELSEQTGVTVKTLYRAFSREFDMGPKRYIHVRRLCGVRQQLLSPDFNNTIADAANSWGFWHMGQFAADYRQHFGELPSDTLGKKKQRSNRISCRNTLV